MPAAVPSPSVFCKIPADIHLLHLCLLPGALARLPPNPTRFPARILAFLAQIIYGDVMLCVPVIWLSFTGQVPVCVHRMQCKLLCPNKSMGFPYKLKPFPEFFEMKTFALHAVVIPQKFTLHNFGFYSKYKVTYAAEDYGTQARCGLSRTMRNYL